MLSLGEYFECACGPQLTTVPLVIIRRYDGSGKGDLSPFFALKRPLQRPHAVKIQTLVN